MKYTAPKSAFFAKALEPAPDRALADAGGRGRRRHRPALRQDALAEQLAAVRTGAGITVELHPVSSLGLSGFDTSQPPRGPDDLLTNVLRSYS
jgi:hypothetical protein